jgi:hypothetical protein
MVVVGRATLDDSVGRTRFFPAATRLNSAPGHQGPRRFVAGAAGAPQKPAAVAGGHGFGLGLIAAIAAPFRGTEFGITLVEPEGTP